MDWQGIEWALPIFEIAIVFSAVYFFVLCLQRVKRGASTKGRAFGWYAAFVIAPVVLYALFFFGLVGFEELTGIAAVSEGLGRTFFVALGLGIAVWLVSILAFGVVLLFLERKL